VKIFRAVADDVDPVTSGTAALVDIPARLRLARSPVKSAVA
jgi:hypothetical protein